MYFVRKIIAIVVGSFLVGIGVNFFLVPHKLIDGGMIGLGLLAKYYFELSPGFVMFLVSLPVYAIVFFYDRRLFYNSFHGMLLSSFFIDICSPLRAHSFLSLPASAVCGGLLIGTGTGAMLAYGTNTGGTDLIAQFFARRMRVPVAFLIFLIDGVIVSSSIEAISTRNLVFSLVTITSVAVSTHFFSQIERESQPWVVIGPFKR